MTNQQTPQDKQEVEKKKQIAVKVIVKCEYCGKEFEKYPSLVKKHNFCCIKCRTESRKNYSKCHICGKTFHQPLSVVKRNKNNYCSVECSVIGKKIFNKITVKNNYAEITIDSKKYGQKDALIDIDDIDKVKNIKWAIAYQKPKDRKNFYVLGHRRDYKSVKIHRLVTDCPKNMVVHHINENPLDNRKINLKIMTNKEHISFHHRKQEQV